MNLQHFRKRPTLLLLSTFIFNDACHYFIGHSVILYPFCRLFRSRIITYILFWFFVFLPPPPKLKEVMFSPSLSLFLFCLFAGYLKKLWTDSDEIFGGQVGCATRTN